jgi:hypothetical protein
MGQNRGKQFEMVIKESFLKVPNVSIDRLPDPMAGYAGIKNICDFIVYKEPYEYYIECKSVHGNTLPFSNITDNQWKGLLEKSKIKGVRAGIICWWVDKDVTLFLPIQLLASLRGQGKKSVRFDDNCYKYVDVKPYYVYSVYQIKGKKKRVFFDYDMKSFLEV